MDNCTMCGAPIPEGQVVCSMCYGDSSFGGDGHYEEYLRKWEEDRGYEQEEEYERDVD